MKTMVITGASRGIGAATALLAAKEGYQVVVNYNQNKAAADKVAAQITSNGGNAVTIRADVTDEKDIEQLFSETIRLLGSLDVLVNNAGVLETQLKLEYMSIDRFRRIFDTNVIGPFLCAREAIKYMSVNKGGRGGVIVNVSSIAAVTGSPNEYVDYAASKGALDSFTIGLSKEVAAEGIRVNAVRPAFIYTDIHADGGEPDRIERIKDSIPLKRGGTAQEVAEAILWLASERSSYCTGAFINVSGGK